MTDPKDSHGDEHIEDLLSQLQGIFGRLSSSEEEESKDKLDVPVLVQPPAATPEAPPVKEPVPPPTTSPAVSSQPVESVPMEPLPPAATPPSDSVVSPSP